MKNSNTAWAALLTAALLLSACGGGSSQRTSTDNRVHARLEYSFPYDTQQEVSPRSPLALRFSHPLTDTAPETAVTWQDDAGNDVAFSAETVDNGRGLLLTPAQALAPATRYRITLGTFNTARGDARVPENGIAFRTRAATRGGREAMTAGQEGATDFVINRFIPDGEQLPVMDFSSFRVQFSQPLARDSVRYGDTVSVTDADGALVPMTVLMKGPYLTLDPQEDLVPGSSYTFSFGAGLRSLFGDALQADSFTLVPKDSTPREVMVQRADDSQNGTVLSPLTGAPINGVPVNALLLGDRSSSQQQGDIHAELAFIPNFPDVTPLRVPRGSLLRGSSVTVEIAGEVPAGFETGEIGVRFVSDAAGFLLPNRYTQAEDSPRHVQLFMDVAMTAENPEANGALSQDLLHLELAGTAIVEGGVLVINAIGIVEPEVLGLEQAWGVLSFRLEAYADQENAPAPEIDSEPPVLQSWVPGEHPDKARPGDPLIFNFTEPLDPNSLNEAIRVTRDGQDEPFDWHLDGASLVVQPQAGLRFNTDYQVQLADTITDLAGNAITARTFDVRLPEYIGSGRAPIALTVYPGYPCATSGANFSNDASEHHGRCTGGAGDDDTLPVMRLPADRAISVQFSQDMASGSIRLGSACDTGTFRVERVDAGGTCLEPVPGTLAVHARRLTFSPDRPWQPGELYRYVLASEQDPASEACGNSAICSQAGYPLQTELLHGRAGHQGGAPMAIHFRGAEAAPAILQTLRNLPTLDINANYANDPGEPLPEEDPDQPGRFLVPKNAAELRFVRSGGLLLDANVGCGFTGGGYSPGKQTCEDKKFLNITGGLMADVIGYDASEDAIKVEIHPTVIMTTSIDVHANLLLLIIPQQQVIPTGPQIMRLRYEQDETGRRTRAITGWIRETAEGPVLDAQLQLYLDAPNLEPTVLGIPLSHNLYSYPLNLSVSGPVRFLEDGRMEIGQLSVGEASDIDVNIQFIGIDGAATMTLRLPTGGVNLNYLSLPVK